MQMWKNRGQMSEETSQEKEANISEKDCEEKKISEKDTQEKQDTQETGIFQHCRSHGLQGMGQSSRQYS